MSAPGGAYRRFRLLSDWLGRRWRGECVPGVDWLRPEVVKALQLRSDGVLDVNLHDAHGGHVLPGDWAGLRLRAVRAPMLTAQAAPPRMTLTRTSEDGTATALVRDRLNRQRCYLMTCGHVVAPDEATRFGDSVRVILSPVSDTVGALREWQPAVGPGNQPSTMDAALVELDEGALALLSCQPSDWLPRGVSSDASAGRSVSLRRVGGPLDGRLVGPWSGTVAGPASGFPDYYLQDAIGYSTTVATVGGDSGAALWSEGDELLGMHIGAINGSVNAANAVMTRVAPALDWYCVKPFTRNDPATLGPDEWPPLPERQAQIAARVAAAQELPPDGRRREQTVLAKTLWGEARGEGQTGMEAVAAVILNRFRTSYRGRSSVEAVCLDPKQFSCWNENDVNLPLMQRIDKVPDPDFRSAMSVAGRALDGELGDPTFGSRHYVATTLPPRLMPDWLRGKTPIVVIGRHAFYNDIL